MPTAMACPVESALVALAGERQARKVVEMALCPVAPHVAEEVVASLRAQAAGAPICWSCATGQTKGLAGSLLPMAQYLRRVARLRARQCCRGKVGVTMPAGYGLELGTWPRTRERSAGGLAARALGSTAAPRVLFALLHDVRAQRFSSHRKHVPTHTPSNPFCWPGRSRVLWLPTPKAARHPVRGLRNILE